MNWYNALVDLDEANIHRFAREIKDISDKIELLGDNRMRHHIDSKIFSDVFSEGIKDIISFLKNEYYFSQAMKSPYYLVDGLTGYLRKNNPNREQLLLIWTTGMVLLDWRLEDNHSSIAALQKAIEICALRNGYCDIHSDLSLLGPAYITVMKEIHDYYCNHAQIFQNRNIIILLCIIMELKVFKEAISCAVLAKYPWMSFIGILTLQ